MATIAHGTRRYKEARLRTEQFGGIVLQGEYRWVFLENVIANVMSKSLSHFI